MDTRRDSNSEQALWNGLAGRAWLRIGWHL